MSATQLELTMRWSDGVDPALADLVAGYRPIPGVHDELVDMTGRVRPRWVPLLSGLARLGRAEVENRFAAADRHLGEVGVVYRVYEDGDAVDRPWPLSHLPVVLEADDWAVLAAGVEQRARLFEAMTADLMGPATLVSSGMLPAAVVAGNPEFLRPLAGEKPAGGRFLYTYAADVTRAPDGRWWVLADRTQAPSGPGYAIENRVALSRALPEAFDELGIEHLGPFFQSMRSGLGRAAGRDEPRIALLTPGPWNETHFEHAFLARSLGFQLVEAGDLVASEAGVAVRTVAGLSPVDVLVRRIDADWADPLELNPNSRLGVPGLVEAVRARRVVVANALGSGLVEAPALTGYLPALARTLIGEDLTLPNVATWWCGEPAARDAVMADLDRLVLAPAFGRTLPGILDSAGILGKKLTLAERARYATKLARRGVDFVGREPLRLSTAPVWDKGRLVPRPFAIRVFAARTADGWRVMPGGLARFAEREDVRLLSMQRGGRSGDVWVLGGAAAEIETRVDAETPLLPEPEDVEIRRDDGILPSRAADNLFWFGRYLERAETTLRLLRGLSGHGDEGVVEISRDLARRIAQLLFQSAAVPSPSGRADTLGEAAMGSGLPGSVGRLVGEARRTGSVVRDRLSPDAWRALGDLGEAIARRAGTDGRPIRIAAVVEMALRNVAAVVGLADETMNRRDGWHFFDLGRRIERAVGLARAVRCLTDGNVGTDALDMVLDLADGRVTYRTRYLAGSARRPVVDLVLLDEANPRSVAFQTARIVWHLERVADRREGDLPGADLRIARRLAARLDSEDADAFDAERIRLVESDLMAISDAVTTHYFTHGSPLPAEEG